MSLRKDRLEQIANQPIDETGETSREFQFITYQLCRICWSDDLPYKPQPRLITSRVAPS